MNKKRVTVKELISGYLAIVLAVVILLLILIFGVKGGIDVFNTGHYFVGDYFNQLIRYIIGTIGFFAVIGLIDYFHSR